MGATKNNYHLKIIETELTKENIPHIACITDKIGENLKKIIEPNKLTVKYYGLRIPFLGFFPNIVKINI